MIKQSKGIKAAVDSSTLRKWAYISSGAAFGLTYGMLTMAGEVVSECLRTAEGFCGFIGGLLNMPATLLSAMFIPRDSLYTPFLQLLSILIIDMLIGASIGFFSAIIFRRHAWIFFGIILVIATIISVAPLLLFFILAE